jgi:hypothetical protein
MMITMTIKTTIFCPSVAIAKLILFALNARGLITND